VLAQSPSKSATAPPPIDILDLRYPEGSRVVLANPDFKRLKVLSDGLSSAGEPQISYDGASVLFCGKAGPSDDWQIHYVSVADGRRRVLTSFKGGAMSPVLLPNGGLVFLAPVTKIGSSNVSRSLYVQAPKGEAHRLTFTSSDISDPTMLADGRILFVEHRRCGPAKGDHAYALLTINNDGTEVTEYSSLPDPTVPLRQPRQLVDGRIAFLLAPSEAASSKQTAQFVRSSRPFHPPVPLLPDEMRNIYSVEPAHDGSLLICAEQVSRAPASTAGAALYRISADNSLLGSPLFSDPAWSTVEAVETSSHQQPMGRLSNVDLSKSTGQILCLNANFTSDLYTSTSSPATAARVRVVAQVSADHVSALGDVPVQADGSFMAEVPADLPLGFEALDNQGNLLRRLAPSIWVRPGENRACIGCHEPHNQSPRNLRPLAVGVPVPVLRLTNPTLAQHLKR
jgi:hypothetical protein